MKDKTIQFAIKLRSKILKDPGKTGRNFLFFIGAYLFLWLFIEPRLILHGGGEIRYFPIFYKGWDFFRESLIYAGGLIEYCSAFLAQLLFYSWSGALVITIQAWLLYRFTDCYLNQIVSKPGKWLSYVPPVLLLALYSQYTFYFTTIMTLITALGFVCIIIKLNMPKIVHYLPVYITLSVILYALAGSSFILFALLCIFFECLDQRRWQIILSAVLSIVFIPYVEGVCLYHHGLADAFFRLTPLFWKFQLSKIIGVNIVYILYLYLFGVSLLLIANRLLMSKFISRESVKTVTGKLILHNALLRWIVSTFILLLVAGAVLLITFDSKRKDLFEVDYYGYYRKWPEVLDAAKTNLNRPTVIAAADRALYHLNRLGSSPLILHQSPGSLIMVGKSSQEIYHWYQFDLYMDLGYYNKAEHNLVESLALYGNQPQLLQRLVIINLIKGNTGTARIYLGTLKKTLFYSRWAARILGEIEKDPSLKTNRQIQHFRKSMLDKEHYIDYSSVDGFLMELLKKNPNNRMAFEYLMTCYLIVGDLENFAKNMYRFQDLHYTKLPVFFQEAVVLIGMDQNLKQYLSKTKLRVEKTTYNRFMKFVQTYNSFSSKREAFKKFPAEFRNTFYFHDTFFDQIYSVR